ncbi:MAG: hypothetical protein ACRDYX_12515 [Egibacteraceae bacterium]
MEVIGAIVLVLTLWLGWRTYQVSQADMFVDTSTPFLNPFYDKKMQRWKLLTYSTLTLSNPGGRPVDVIGALAAEEPLKSAFLGREDDLIFTDPERRI